MNIKALDEKAQSVLKAAKQNNMDGVINIFDAISVPFKSGEKGYVFKKIFELAGIDAEWRDDIGFVIFSKHRTEKAVVSHMDLIPKFEKGFEKGDVYRIFEGKLIGALDNTFTNAVVINSILNKQCKKTTYLFTLDEESSQKAMRGYMEKFGIHQFIINLDVTNEGMKHNMSIEYDEPSWHICKQIHESLHTPFFTTERVCDDLDQVMKVDGRGFSYCLPTDKTIHSYENYTMLDKIEPYMRGLDFLIHEMCVKNTIPNIEYISIKEVLKEKSFEKMKKKDIYESPKPTYVSTYSSVKGSEDDIDIKVSKGDSSDKKLLEFSEFLRNIMSAKIMKQGGNPAEKFNDINNFLEDTLLVGDFFSEQEFRTVLNANLFWDMMSLKLIKPMYGSKDIYDFNTDLMKSKVFKFYKKAKKEDVINISAFSAYLLEMESDRFTFDEIKEYKKQYKNKKDIVSFIEKLSDKGVLEMDNDHYYFQIK